MTDDLHIFPFCRQSYETGLREAISIVDGSAALFTDPDGMGAAIKAAIRARLGELTPSNPDQAA
jgi:hypothetical protein